MDSDILLFVSSTSDLKQERRALEAELHGLYRVFLYEDFGAGSNQAGNTTPEMILQERIRRADVFICLLGPRYGSPYKPPEDLRSIVEWEFSTAEGFPDLEVMPFRKIVPEDQIEPRQLAFINRISSFGKGGRWCEKFDSPQTLATVVRESLEKWLVRQYKKAQAKVTPWLSRVLVPIAIGSVGLCLLVGLLFVMEFVALSKTSVLGLCVLVFFTVLLCFMLFWSQIGGKDERVG